MIERDLLYVGGEWIEPESGRTTEVVYPFTEEPIGRAALAGSADVDRAVRAARGADIGTGNKGAAIVDARLFDRFTGAGVEEGMQSLGIEVTLQPGERSFTDAEIAEISAKVVAAAEKVGGRLRR